MAASSIFVSWRDEVVDRLYAASSKQQVLQRWLEGYELPPVDSYTEGNAWLLEAARELSRLARDLAEPAAQLLDSYARRTLESRNYERLAFNLFYLCAGLRNPSAFWRPLLNILENDMREDGRTRTASYQGVPVLMAFRAALAQNQQDGTFEPVWRRMLGDRSEYFYDTEYEKMEGIVRFLNGSPMDGFEGILGLPGEVNEALVGWALARMADTLDQAPFRETQFARLLDRVQARFDVKEWNWGMLVLLCNWREWAEDVLQKHHGNLQPPVQIDYVSGDDVEVQRKSVKIPHYYKSMGSRMERGIKVIAIDSFRAGLQPSLTARHIKEYVSRYQRKERSRR